MTKEDIKKLAPDDLLALHQVELERAYADGERKGILHGLGWDGLTDEEVTWVCKRLKEKGKFLFQPTVGQLRELIAKEKEEDKPRSIMFDEGLGDVFKNLGDLETGLIP